jgi:hypothetical protein
MANTTNFNWETPDDTDLVKDGAAAIRTLGSAIDTSLVDLKGGTTGQVLSKATNTDMDFTWVAQDDSNAIQNAIVDAKGDIVAASANDTPARLAVGTDNHRLIAASGETTGLKYVADTQNTVIDAEGDLLVGHAADALQRLAIGSNAQVLTVDTSVDGKIKWATPAGGGGGKVLQVIYASVAGSEVSNSTTTFADTGLTATITPSSATSKVLVLFSQQGVMKGNGNVGNSVKMRLVRGATAILDPITTIHGYTDTLIRNVGSVSSCFLDSPSTTSATTYKTQFANRISAALVAVQYDSNETSTMILMEIGA